MLETFFSSFPSSSTCSIFFALVTAIFLIPRQSACRAVLDCSPGQSRQLRLRRSLNRAGVNRNSRAHGRTQVAALDVLALGHRRLGLDHAGDHGGGVLDQLLAAGTKSCRQAREPAPSCRCGTPPCRLSLPARLCATSKVTVPVFGFGIRPLGPRTLPSRPTDFITSGVAIRASKSVQFSLCDLLDHIFAANEIGAGRFGFLHLVAGGDDQNFLRLAQTVRQNDGAAHHLVGVLGIDSETHGDFDGLIELGVFHFLQKRQPHPAADTVASQPPAAPW